MATSWRLVANQLATSSQSSRRRFPKLLTDIHNINCSSLKSTCCRQRQLTTIYLYKLDHYQTTHLYSTPLLYLILLSHVDLRYCNQWHSGCWQLVLTGRTILWNQIKNNCKYWCREYWYIGRRRLECSYTTTTIGSNITINDFEGICGGGELRVEVDA